MGNANARVNGATLQEVLALGQRPLYSVYLDLAVGPNGQRRHDVFLKKKETQLLELAELEETNGAAVRRVLRAVRTWLDRDYDEANRGAALFLSPEGELLKAVQLPAAVENLFAFREGPVVAPLARLVEDHDHHCVVVADSARARILSVYLNAVEREESYADDTIPPRTRGGGWSQARFQRHRAAHVQQFHAEVAEHLERFVERHACSDIILLGPEEATAELLKELPAALRERVRFVRPASSDEPTPAVVERIQALLRAELAREDEQVLARLERRVREDYLAVGGVRATLRELQAGAVETLVLAWRVRREGRQCRGCGFLFAEDPGACPYCGGALAEVDLYDRMVELGERQGAKVEFLEGDASAELVRRMNGAGALLKFQREPV